MTHVTEHHAEEEWESSYTYNSGIGLLVSWNSVCVHNQLIDFCEFIRFYVCWPAYPMVLVRAHTGCREWLKLLRDLVLFLNWSPKVPYKNLILEHKHVQGLV